MKAEWQEQLVYTNDFKIRFCNAFDALSRHTESCTPCAAYLRSGDGDLCDSGKRAICNAMVLEIPLAACKWLFKTEAGKPFQWQ